MTALPHHVRFWLIVTGQGERQFLPGLLRSLCAAGEDGRTADFQVLRRIGQLRPITSEKRLLKMTGQGKKNLPSRDQELGLAVRNALRQGHFVALVDDLEGDWRPKHRACFERYREAIDGVVSNAAGRARASVHFLVNMLEAYYFADARVLNEVLGLNLVDHNEDVEDIPYPKNQLKRLANGFDEVEHGGQIVPRLNLEHILSRGEHGASLRALVGWCERAMGRAFGERFQLAEGRIDAVTGGQIGLLGAKAIDG